nr:unnamed protein product [Digitaria exilis]
MPPPLDGALAGDFLREVCYLEACRGHPCLVELRVAHLDPTGDSTCSSLTGASRRPRGTTVRCPLAKDDASPLVPAPHAAWVVAAAAGSRGRWAAPQLLDLTNAKRRRSY